MTCTRMQGGRRNGHIHLKRQREEDGRFVAFEGALWNRSVLSLALVATGCPRKGPDHHIGAVWRTRVQSSACKLTGPKARKKG